MKPASGPAGAGAGDDLLANVDHSSFVMKQTEDGKRWQKRFLVASGPRVWYFGRPGEPPSKARDVFNMKRALKIEAVPGQKPTDFGFAVSLPARTYVFCVDNEAEQQKWLAAFNACPM